MRIRFIHIILVVITSVIIISCGGGKRAEVRHTVAEEAAVADSSVLVRLEAVNQQSIHVTILKTNANKSYDFSQAKSVGKIIGSLQKGDTLSIYPNENNGEIRSLINISELVGTWFYDMNQHRGFKLGHGGALSSINMENVNFHNWQVKNGEFIIHYVDMQQIANDESTFWVDHANIVKLNKDELDISFRDSLMHCKHLKEVIKFKL